MAESVQVSIFGQMYSLRCDADADITRRVANYVDSKMIELKEVTASRDNMKVAVIAALNIAGELFETKAKYEAELKKSQECQEKLKALNEKIARASDT